MKTSATRTNTSHPAVGKTMATFAFAALIGGLSVQSAFAEDWRYNNDHHGDWRHQRYEGNYYRPSYYQTPYYQPYNVYAPPPVIYYPPRSPGISLFFPINIR